MGPFNVIYPHFSLMAALTERELHLDLTDGETEVLRVLHGQASWLQGSGLGLVHSSHPLPRPGFSSPHRKASEPARCDMFPLCSMGIILGSLPSEMLTVFFISFIRTLCF